MIGVHLQSEILATGWDVLNWFSGRRRWADAYASLTCKHSENLRTQQLMCLRSLFGTEDNANLIYLGDFNISREINSPNAEYRQMLKLLDGRPVLDQTLRTIGVYNNTSHTNLGWWLGSWVWNAGQVDHAILSHWNDSVEATEFKVMSYKNRHGVSLTDHEGIFFNLS